jgi:hypothetical protein
MRRCPAQKRGGLSGRVSSTNDDRLGSLAITGLAFSRGIVNPGPLESGQPFDRQPSILNARRNHDRPGTHSSSVIERAAEGSIGKPVQTRHPPRSRELSPELQRLHLTAPDEVGTRYARRKT